MNERSAKERVLKHRPKAEAEFFGRSKGYPHDAWDIYEHERANARVLGSGDTEDEAWEAAAAALTEKTNGL